MMDILDFREQVKVVLKEQGATFPNWDAERKAISEIASAAIKYMDSRVTEVLESKS